MSTSEYRVVGMSCDNCERHVREEILRIPGVTAAAVNHRTGLLRVSTAAAPVSDAAVAAAVDEAGYTIAAG